MLELTKPKTLKELKLVRGLFAYHAKWIAHFSSTIRPLIGTEVLPLSNCIKRAFETQKKGLGNVTLMSIDKNQSFAVEIDASQVAISVTL